MNRTLLVLLMLTVATAFATAGAKSEETTASVDNINPPGVFPIAKERMELKILMPVQEFVNDIHTNESILWAEEYTNIDFVIDEVVNANERVQLLLAAQQDLPDVFLTYNAVSLEQLNLYGPQGVFEPVNPYLEDGWLPNVAAIFAKHPLVRAQLTLSDGNLYSLMRYLECFHCNYSQKFFMNTTWLDNLGLEVPETPDELYDVLVSFRDNDANGNGDPNDEIPLLGMTSGWRPDLTGFLMQPFAPATLIQDLYLYLDDGKIRSGMHDPGWPEGMKYLARLYADGLLDEEAFVMDRSMARALTGSNPNRVGSMQAGFWGLFVNLGMPGAREELNPIAPLKAADGSRRTLRFPPTVRPNWVVTTVGSEETRLAAMRLGDLQAINPFSGRGNDLEVGLNMWLGPNGWVKPKAGTLGINGKPALFDQTFVWAEPTNSYYGNLGWLYLTADYQGYLAVSTSSTFDAEKVIWDATAEHYVPYAVDIKLPPIVLPADQASELGEIKQILNDYVMENIAAFIIGDRDVSNEWNDFLAELDDFGFGRYQEAVQQAYDEMYK